MMHSILEGCRVLVVEDEFMIAMLIEETLADHRCLVVGPINNLSDAVDAARHGTVDIAILDVDLSGEKVYPVAELLDQRGIPFVLLSGYGGAAVPADRPAWRICSKPFRRNSLIDILAEQIGALQNRGAGIGGTETSGQAIGAIGVDAIAPEYQTEHAPRTGHKIDADAVRLLR